MKLPLFGSGALQAGEGMDAALLAGAMERAAALPRLHALIVARNGTVRAERAFCGPGLDRPVNIKSVSKYFISALVGVAIERGVLGGAGQPIVALLPDRLPPAADPRLARVTIGNLLSMQSGLQRTSGRNYGRWVMS